MQRCANDVTHLQLAPNTESHVWNAKGNERSTQQEIGLSSSSVIVRMYVGGSYLSNADIKVSR